MTFITIVFRVSVVSDVRERKRALYGKQCVRRISLTNLIFSNLHILMDICLFSTHCKHVPCSTLTDSTNEDLPNIKRKGDTKSRILSRTDLLRRVLLVEQELLTHP
jgi:hypothetical protein